MIWVDREVEKIKKRKLALEWVDDMKTPSGRVHVGALRGVVIHDLVYKALLGNKVKSKYTYVFDDQDPMDAIPAYLDFSQWEKYAGVQLYKIPSPQKGYKSFAEFYAKEFLVVFESINCHPEIIWGSQLYLNGKMNGVIKEVLDKVEIIRKIYNRMFDKKRPKDWYPFNVVCQNCGKIGTTYVYDWDGKEVHYRCEPTMVAWAKGCGNKGKVSPYDGNGKIPWKVEWAAKWKVVGVTIEGAGKDHMSKGGSYDVAAAICNEVLDYKPPYPVAYEWFNMGGKSMSSSKGIGTSAKEASRILPPDVFRFFIVRTPIETAIDFNPEGDTIPNIFDDYDRCLNAYFDKLEKKIPEGKQGEVLSDFARIIELSEVKPLPKKRLFLPRFRTVANLIKTKTELLKFFGDHKGSPLTSQEKEILEERIEFARVYLQNYAGKENRVEFLEESPKELKLTQSQKEFLNALAKKLTEIKSKSREKVQQIVFDVLKSNNFSAKEVFPGFYQVLIGQNSGPKAADLILTFGIDKVTKRFKEIIN